AIHKLTTITLKEAPSATEVLAAQAANLSWVKVKDKGYSLAQMVSLRGIFDYKPEPAAALNAPAPGGSKAKRFSYANKVANHLWPLWTDAIYVELRKSRVTDEQAESECIDGTSPSPDNDVVCGYIKLGNLGQILQTLGKMACRTDQCGEE